MSSVVWVLASSSIKKKSMVESKMRGSTNLRVGAEYLQGGLSWDDRQGFKVVSGTFRERFYGDLSGGREELFQNLFSILYERIPKYCKASFLPGGSGERCKGYVPDACEIYVCCCYLSFRPSFPSARTDAVKKASLLMQRPTRKEGNFEQSGRPSQLGGK